MQFYCRPCAPICRHCACHMQALRGQKIQRKRPSKTQKFVRLWGRPELVGDARLLFEVRVAIVRQFNFKAGFNSNGYSGEANRMTRFQHIRRVCCVQNIRRVCAVYVQALRMVFALCCNIFAMSVQHIGWPCPRNASPEQPMPVSR